MTTANVTIQDAFEGAAELLMGPRTPSFKLAMYAAAMSPMQELGKNGRQTRILASYVDNPLPDNDTLFNELRKAKGNLNGVMVGALYRIEALDNAGLLEPYKILPETLEEQMIWRENLRKLVTGYGMSWKTVSFAALIYAPMDCQLVPIDRHVMKRLGYETDASPSSKKRYLAVEQQIIHERKEAGYENVPLGIWHWYKWEEWRQLEGDSKTEEGVESHKDLSCRDY